MAGGTNNNQLQAKEAVDKMAVVAAAAVVMVVVAGIVVATFRSDQSVPLQKFYQRQLATLLSSPPTD